MGIEVSLSFVPVFSEFYATVARGPSAFISQWIWQDPMDAIIGFSSSGPEGGANYQHSQVVDLESAFADWTAAQSETELATAARQAQRTFARTLPYIPLVSPISLRAIDRSFLGLDLRDAGLYPDYGGIHRGDRPS